MIDEQFFDNLAQELAMCVIYTHNIGYDGFDEDKAKDILKKAFAQKDLKIVELETIIKNSQ